MGLSRRSFIGFPALLAFPAMLRPAIAQSIEPYPLVHKKSALAKGRMASQVNKSKSVDPRIGAMLAQIDGTRLMQRVAALEAFKTRHSLAPENKAVELWLSERFAEAGYPAERIRQQVFTMPTGEQLNNVLLFPGDAQKSFVLVCAHFDSTSEQAAQLAPGADDNGSGIAVLLELAEVIKQVSLERGVLFAAFNGEEQGLIGSQACAKIAAKDRWPIDLVINLDMVGFVPPSTPSKIVIEYDQGNAVSTNEAAAKSFALQMAQVAADFTSLTVEHTNIWSSDYMPFEKQGFNCVGLYDEGGDASFYHTSNDTSENVNEARMVEVAKLVVASVVSICGLPIS